MVQSLRHMNFAFNNVRLYPPTHSEVVGVLGKLHGTLTPILEEQEDIGYGFMDELLYLEGAMSIEETAANQMLVDRFSKCRVKYLTIMRGVTQDDLLTFFQILNAEATKPTTEHPAELLDQKGVQTIHIVEADLDETASKSKLVKKKTLLDWYERAIQTLKSAQLDLFRDGVQPDLKALYRVVDDMMATIRNKGCEPFLLLPLLSQAMDPHLTHSVNTAILCCALGDVYGLNSGQIHTLCGCAYLHDLGRLTLPPELHRNEAPLTEEDRALIHQHSDWGFLLLTRNEELAPQIGLLAAQHHIASPTDLYHKILALADEYDLALAGGKYYWKKGRKDRILARILNQRGGRYDPILVKLLVNCVGYYPVGSLVGLDDGQRGIVVRPNPGNPLRPKVYLFEAPPAPRSPAEGEAAPSAQPPAEEEPPPVVVDLSEFNEAGTGFKRSVAAILDPTPDVDVFGLLDLKKEYLLSYTI